MHRRKPNMPKKKATFSVCWRLPVDMIEKLGPIGIRKLLLQWYEKRRRRLRPPDGHAPLRNVCYRMPEPLLVALEAEAARLSKATGVTWSVARVVREILRTAPGE
jgi:hypothetical protein